MRRVCAECKAVNRIPVRHLADTGRCGKCKAPLPPHATPIENTSESQFDEIVAGARVPVLVDFWATWCGPCQVVAPILDQLAGEYAGKAKVAKVDVDANQRTAMRFNVRSIPSILFFKNGQHVDTVIGAVPKATLEGKIKQHLA